MDERVTWGHRRVHVGGNAAPAAATSTARSDMAPDTVAGTPECRPPVLASTATARQNRTGRLRTQRSRPGRVSLAPRRTRRWRRERPVPRRSPAAAPGPAPRPRLRDHHRLGRDQHRRQLRLLQQVQVLAQALRADHEHVGTPATRLLAGDRAAGSDHVQAVRRESARRTPVEPRRAAPRRSPGRRPTVAGCRSGHHRWPCIGCAVGGIAAVGCSWGCCGNRDPRGSRRCRRTRRRSAAGRSWRRRDRVASLVDGYPPTNSPANFMRTFSRWACATRRPAAPNARVRAAAAATAVGVLEHQVAAERSRGVLDDPQAQARAGGPGRRRPAPEPLRRQRSFRRVHAGPSSTTSSTTSGPSTCASSWIRDPDGV